MRRTGAESTARIVPTPELIKQILVQRPPGWAWATFASVVFQRWAAVEQRKVDQVLGIAVPPTCRLRTGPGVARFVLEHLRAVDALIDEVDVFLRSPAFTGVFGSADDEDTADAAGIVRVGHRLGDHYERLLGLAEDCRSCSVPAPYASLLRDCTRFANEPLHDFGGYVDDVLERHEALQERIASGRGYRRPTPPALHTTYDDRLIWSMMDRLSRID